MVEHHALCQEFGEGLADFHQAQVAHDFGPEPRVQQVQDGVLDATNVLVHRHPVIGTFCHHGLVIFRIAIAHEIPRRIDKRIHSVGLAPRRNSANGADYTGVKTSMVVQRVAGTVRDTILRQHDRQVFLGYRYRPVFRAVNDGDGRTPVALAAHAPVTQAPGGFLLPKAALLELVANSVYRFLVRHATVVT